ncbi:hypothetical protein KKA95_02625 [Patescibacteria group bacterium]|nr:hypothetical protein [Patescibacteria group bacterium]
MYESHISARVCIEHNADCTTIRIYDLDIYLGSERKDIWFEVVDDDTKAVVFCEVILTKVRSEEFEPLAPIVIENKSKSPYRNIIWRFIPREGK